MITDAHLDIAFNAQALGRDFFLSAHEQRRLDAAAPKTPDICTAGLPDLQAADVGLVFGSIFVETARASAGPGAPPTYAYTTPEEAHALALEQLACYDKLLADPRFFPIRSRADLVTLEERRTQQPTLGLLVEIEGGDPILSPAEVAAWQGLGVRQIGPAWSFSNRYCGGNREPGPLTADGVVLLREMERLGMILDTSHLAEESFWQALSVFNGPVVFSHGACRALVPGERQISDKMMQAIAEQGGVIGIVLYNGFLKDGWTRAHGKDAVTLADVIRHIDHVCQITGDATHVGLGSDLDGGFGRDETPAEIDTAADLVRIAPALAGAGYTAADIDNIMNQNWLRFLRRSLPEVS